MKTKLTDEQRQHSAAIADVLGRVLILIFAGVFLWVVAKEVPYALGFIVLIAIFGYFLVRSTPDIDVF